MSANEFDDIDEDEMDEHDWSIVARNLTLTPDQRLDKVTAHATFVLDGRRAMEAAKRRQGSLPDDSA